MPKPYRGENFRDQYKVADLLAALAAGDRPGKRDQQFILDFSDKIGALDVRTKGALLSLSEKLRSYDAPRAATVRDIFTKEERRALYVLRCLVEWVNPSTTDPHDNGSAKIAQVERDGP